MDKVIAVLNKTAETFRALTSVGLALLATAVIVQVLFGANAPFIPVDVIGGIVGVTKQLGSEGLVGLAAVGVLLALFGKK
jgi:hypothetical protein|tara:strand:- start:3169 stop:3408 length:240 start_codon:yes stop_codon:yes gene_type:complete